MFKVLAVLHILFFVSYCQNYYINQTCEYENYNLIHLQYNPGYAIPPGYNYTTIDSSGNLNIVSINFCAQVGYATGCIYSIPGACQFYGPGKEYAIGLANNIAFSTVDDPIGLGAPILGGGWQFNEGVILTYYEGQFCSQASRNSITTIAVVCPPTGYNGILDGILTVAEAPMCVFEVIFVSNAGCSTAK